MKPIKKVIIKYDDGTTRTLRKGLVIDMDSPDKEIEYLNLSEEEFVTFCISFFGKYAD